MGIKFSHGKSNEATYNNNNNYHQDHEDEKSETKMEYEKTKNRSGGFKIPLHYPKYTKSDYEKMPEWQLDQILKNYGLPIIGDSHEKRKFAIGAFLWLPENEQ